MEQDVLKAARALLTKEYDDLNSKKDSLVRSGADFSDLTDDINRLSEVHNKIVSERKRLNDEKARLKSLENALISLGIGGIADFMNESFNSEDPAKMKVVMNNSQVSIKNAISVMERLQSVDVSSVEVLLKSALDRLASNDINLYLVVVADLKKAQAALEDTIVGLRSRINDIDNRIRCSNNALGMIDRCFIRDVERAPLNKINNILTFVSLAAHATVTKLAEDERRRLDELLARARAA